MNGFKIFIVATALSCLALFPAVARADDELDDLDVTMDVFDDEFEFDQSMTTMRGPEDFDDDDDWEDDESDDESEDESEDGNDDDSDGDFEMESEDDDDGFDRDDDEYEEVPDQYDEEDEIDRVGGYDDED